MELIIQAHFLAILDITHDAFCRVLPILTEDKTFEPTLTPIFLDDTTFFLVVHGTTTHIGSAIQWI